MKFPSPARRLYGSLGGRLFFCALALSSVSALAETGEIYGKLPLSFELNRGQTDGTVDFLARGPGYSLFLTPQEAVFVLAQQNVRQAAGGGPAPKSIKERSAKATDTLGSPAVLRMKLSGASAKAAVRGLDELEGKVSYFIGDDPATWRANISTYSRVQYDDIYPGVDLIYYGNQRQLEYDFVIKPGSDARRIALKFDGARKVVINAAGELLIKIGEKTFRQARPSIYQRVAQGRRTVSGGYVLRSGGRVGFSVGEYDRQRPLIIDPVLVYSTYLGGSGDDRGYGIAVDSSGNAYVTGSTSSINYPTVGPIQAAGGGGDAFVTKINATGT
ncbi:MAG: hypothetical protein QOE73_413, partial [Verrucomicrobiota bacterium]